MSDDESLGELFNRVWLRGVQNHFRFSASSPIAGNIHDIRFLALALCGEAGELANIIKKQWRGDVLSLGGDAHDEVADVLAYVMMLAHQLGMDPESLLWRVDRKQNIFAEKMKSLKGETPT